MEKYITIFIILFLSFTASSQEVNFDNYKYIVISDKFHFVKTIDGYQTSSLTKFLFEKKGFQAFLSSENFPDDLSQNKCLALFADVKDESDFLTNKSIIELNDCRGKNVYTSKPGKSKLKDYKKAYQESIRNAFNSMTDFEYSYQPKEKSIVLLEIKKEVIDRVFPKKDTIIQYNEQFISVPTIEDLIAQPITHGFQLVNSTFEKVYIILSTSVDEVFILKDKNGFVYKRGNIWFIEYYENEKLIKKQTQIKF